MLLVAATAGAVSRPAQAQVADCIKEPTAQAPEGTHWVGHWEINNYRRCWVLVDAAGREVTAPVPAPPVNPPQSAWQSFLGNLTGASTPQPQAAPASPAAASPRKPPPSQPDGPHPVATASKPARSEPPKSEAKSEVRPVKPDKSQADRDALYAEFLRWRESQKITGAK
jgi:hypothetical protein